MINYNEQGIMDMYYKLISSSRAAVTTTPRHNMGPDGSPTSSSLPPGLPPSHLSSIPAN